MFLLSQIDHVHLSNFINSIKTKTGGSFYNPEKWFLVLATY